MLKKKTKSSIPIVLSVLGLVLLTGVTTIKTELLDNELEKVYSETVNSSDNTNSSNNDTNENKVIVSKVKENIITVEKEVIKAPFNLKRLGTFTIKGYCSCDICKSVKGNPKNIRETEGVNAIADLSIIPEGTMIWANGVGIRQIQPSSRKTEGNYILVYFDNHDDVVNFGQREEVLYKIMN